MMLMHRPSHVVSQANKTALVIVSEKGYVEVAKALLDAGANKEVEDKVGGVRSPSMWSPQQTQWCLLSDVAVYSLVSQDGKSVLDLASIYGHAEVVQALLDAGADKDAKSGEVGGGCEVMGGVV